MGVGGLIGLKVGGGGGGGGWGSEFTATSLFGVGWCCWVGLVGTGSTTGGITSNARDCARSDKSREICGLILVFTARLGFRTVGGLATVGLTVGLAGAMCGDVGIDGKSSASSVPQAESRRGDVRGGWAEAESNGDVGTEPQAEPQAGSPDAGEHESGSGSGSGRVGAGPHLQSMERVWVRGSKSFRLNGVGARNLLK